METALDARWPFLEQTARLADMDRDRIRADRLGEISFEEAVSELDRILDSVKELVEEDFETVGADFANQVRAHLDQTIDIAQQMATLSLTDPNVLSIRNDLASRLSAELNWFLQNVKPKAITARVRDAVAALPYATQRGTVAEEQLRELGARIESAASEAERIEHELAARADLVEAMREDAGRSGASDLAKHYRQIAREHSMAWKRWGIALVSVSIAALLMGVLILVYVHSGPNAEPAEIVRFVVFDLLAIGLALFAVRTTALQFRVHRHLEAQAASKAAALDTFSRMTSVISEPEIRAAVAATLAQCVFDPGDSGFIGTDNDGITVIERMAPVVQRAVPSAQ